MSYSAETLLHRARLPAGEPGLVNRVSPPEAGWKDLTVEMRRLARSARWSAETGGAEGVLVVLGGVIGVRSSHGEWPQLGRRTDVFSGMPHALYLPRGTRFEVVGLTERVELAWATAPTERDHPARRIAPSDVAIEIRGGGTNTRQINAIVPPGFDCDRLVCVEVYTPSGNWSSYPPHKHDLHRAGQDGGLLEADLEEIYLYKMREPGGHALQRIYTGDGALDVTVTARDGDIVLVPYGYHPVSAPYGYDCYYINFLAGSAQSLACADDPEHAWIKSTWTTTDPRIPMVTHEMERVAAATAAGRELAR